MLLPGVLFTINSEIGTSWGEREGMMFMSNRNRCTDFEELDFCKTVLTLERSRCCDYRAADIATVNCNSFGSYFGIKCDILDI